MGFPYVKLDSCARRRSMHAGGSIGESARRLHPCSKPCAPRQATFLLAAAARWVRRGHLRRHARGGRRLPLASDLSPDLRAGSATIPPCPRRATESQHARSAMLHRRWSFNDPNCLLTRDHRRSSPGSRPQPGQPSGSRDALLDLGRSDSTLAEEPAPGSGLVPANGDAAVGSGYARSGDGRPPLPRGFG